MFTQLDDLDFADYIALLSHNHQQMQDKLEQVEKTAAETGLSINHNKTKVLKSNTKSKASLMVNIQALEEVESFTYLGSVVDNLGGSDKDVKIRIGKVRTALNIMGRILNIRLPEKISKKDLWEKTNQSPVDEELKKRKWLWIGHTLRKPKTNIIRQALQWNPQGTCSRGRPRHTWRRNVAAEMEKEGYKWHDLERLAKNRT
ncbi:Hypothetical predicted protein [Mytilus galloprovincialis]|uniref:Reverse transcriptase domain-containing protein n=1 Tax=Mytilus galloprovincialis TaxID=29158 RepID=A0A8B6EYY9_MYTGA|nr:Hypothetical predicted protein [Mytilus galloprovincialis]